MYFCVSNIKSNGKRHRAHNSPFIVKYRSREFATKRQCSATNHLIDFDVLSYSLDFSYRCHIDAQSQRPVALPLCTLMP